VGGGEGVGEADGMQVGQLNWKHYDMGEQRELVSGSAGIDETESSITIKKNTINFK